MAKEMIKDLDVACAKLEDNFWDVSGAKVTPVLDKFDPILFLYKEDVQKMKEAIAKNLRNTSKEAENYSNEQIKNYIGELANIKTSFEKIVLEKSLEAAKLNPKKANIAKIINEIGK
jgi:hypothetical protein